MKILGNAIALSIIITQFFENIAMSLDDFSTNRSPRNMRFFALVSSSLQADGKNNIKHVSTR